MKRCAYCGFENPMEAVRCRQCGTDEFRVPASIDSAPSPPPKHSEVELEPVDPEPDVAPEEEAALCTFCLFPNMPNACWCKKCGAPVSYGGIVGPADAARATSFMWRGALRGRPKLFVFVTIWIWFLPLFVVNVLCSLGYVILLLTGRMSPLEFCFLCWGALMAMVSFGMLFQITRNLIKVPRIQLDED